MANREAGGHISIVASCESEPFYEPSDAQKRRPHYRFVTLDGKSFDGKEDDPVEPGWNESLANLSQEELNKLNLRGRWQGVAQNRRRTDKKKDPLRGFIDTSKLREALGYR